MAVWLRCVATCIAFLLAATAAAADPVEDFYRGKTIRVLIGYGAGGGYDLYGRLAAEFLGRHIPGHPTIIAQNMPGGGSFIAAANLYNVVPKDGTFLGTVAQTLALDTAVAGPGSKNYVDARQLPYIGRLTSNIDTGVARLSANIKSFDDARQRPLVVGGTAGASTSNLLPLALNQFGGAKFKVVRGYAGANEVMLALEREEVDVVGATGLPLLLASRPDWVDGSSKKAMILYQAALTRHALLPNAPALPELAVDDDARAALRAIASTAEIGRSIITTPGVPPERLTALRKAFAEMVRDPDFLAAAQKRNIMIDPGAGETLDAITRETMQLPKSLLDKIGLLLKE